MTLRFGLVGYGYHGKAAVTPSFYLKDAVGVELKAICDANAEAVAAIDRPVEKYTSVDEMLAKAPIDAVYVAVGIEYHSKVAIAALKAGKHVVCEKPMAQTLEQCKEMVETAKANNRILAINFETRYSQKIQLVKRWINEGRFGRIDAIHFDNLWDGHKNFGAVAERRARLISVAGGLDCGVHELDQARFFLGGNWTTVHAVGAWFGEPFNPPPHIGIIGVMDNGPMVTLNASLGFAAQIEPRPMVDNLVVAGNEGVAVLRTDVLAHHTVAELSSRTLCEKVEFSTTGHASDIALLISEVAKVAENGPDTPHFFATGEDGYQAQLAMELANSEAQKNRVK
ncbi:MAG: Gfo/Idh/MocA family oxidoreductase [Victivallales bacterium]|nr:Gfo/Idh/MocA family oxidoreductase [Victivallales bacterium]